MSRRHFIAAMSAGAHLSSASVTGSATRSGSVDEKLALAGGRPVRADPFPSWPVIDEADRVAWRKVLNSGQWYRSSRGYVGAFERAWAETLDANFVLATASGTSALYTALFALDIAPGDEVIVPPYTFVATVNVVFQHHALPIFVDSDRRTFQIDAAKIPAAVSERTRCILPVHLGGNVADMDAILELSEKYNLPVLEDACQAHLSEWRGKKVGTLGRLGCFSFQASKNLNSGEGGAISSNDADLMTVCASFHNAGRGYEVKEDSGGRQRLSRSSQYERRGDNCRMTEFQAALLGEQLKRLEVQAQTREQNARYLSGMLNDIPGITPAEQYHGCTQNAFHLYMFRCDGRRFSGLSRPRFIEALRAEGIPCSSGYRPLNREPYVKRTLESRAFRRVYTSRELEHWFERNQCPENDRLCSEAIWLSQKILLGTRSDMDEIAAAVKKISRLASTLSADDS